MSHTTSGQVVLDGSLGPAGTLPGPQVVVPASAGVTAGQNLFHSFGRFDVAGGTSVEFQGPDSVQRILARVTGGSPSSVNGQLICAIPGADLYLINPDGVLFGPGASLRLRGSLAVTSADYVRLGADARFHARLAEASVLATAPPAAFGFMGTQGAITVEGATLGVEGRSLSLVGRDVSVRGGELSFSAGTINLTAVGTAAGEATIDATPRGPVVSLPPGAAGGAVEVLDGARVDVSGPTPGRVHVRGGSLTVRGAEPSTGAAALIIADATGGAADDAGLAVDVELTGPAGAGGPLDVGPAGLVVARATGAAPGGSVRIVAGRVTLDGGAGATADSPTNGIATSSTAAGPAGSIALTAGDLRILNRAVLGSSAESQGRGGDVTVGADAIEIASAGLIFAEAAGAGAGGNVSVTATGPVTLDDRGSAIFTSSAAGATGDAGDLALSATDLRITDLAFASSATNGAGDAGNITVTAASVFLDGAGDNERFTGIGANSEFELGATGSGAGGSVMVTADRVEIRDGAGIAAVTFGSEPGGNVTLDLTGDLLVEARPGVDATGLTAEARSAAADGGRVSVRARGVELRNGQISASATGVGGDVEIRAAEAVRLVDGRIDAEAGPLGGNITVEAEAVLLSRGVLSANAVQVGGVITIASDAFFPSTDPETSVTASGGFSAGTVVTPEPDTDVAAGLLRLPGSLADDAARLQALCGMRLTGGASSFVVTGRGGAPIEPGGFQPAFAPAGRRRGVTLLSGTASGTTVFPNQPSSRTNRLPEPTVFPKAR